MDEFEYLKDNVLAGLEQLERQAAELKQYDIQQQIRQCIRMIMHMQVILPFRY